MYLVCCRLFKIWPILYHQHGTWTFVFFPFLIFWKPIDVWIEMWQPACLWGYYVSFSIPWFYKILLRFFLHINKTEFKSWSYQLKVMCAVNKGNVTSVWLGLLSVLHFWQPHQFILQASVLTTYFWLIAINQLTIDWLTT